MDFHPIASIFPLLEGAELEALAADIREHGLREEVVLYEGKVLDGRNRTTAALMAGVTPKTREFQGSHQEALAFVWSENFHRRHLNPGQAAIAEAMRVKLDAEYAAELDKKKAEARQRKTANAPKKGERGFQNVERQEIDAPQRTDAARSRAVGTNRTYLNAAERLVEDDPERAEAVLKGKKSLTQAMREVKREAMREQPALPTGKFRVLYADPPWKYQSGSGAGLEQYGPAERHYPAMSIDELCALDVAELAEENAVLFLWVTSPMLEEAFKVIRAWGFRYKASFVWDKVKHNFGHYNSVRHEFLLVAVRGSCVPDSNRLFDSVQTIERSEKHSEKPEEFRDIIETLYSSGARLELFARETVDNWQAWGNEA
jgi:N6-adenosine-specific RNA methylase IME4